LQSAGIRPVAYDDITDHFKYGSIGSEPGVSLMRPVGGVLPPLSVFTALPSICPEKLPGGYASLGFIFEKGHTLPVGVSQRRRIGIDHVGLNCAVCHTGTVRDAPDAEPRIVLGMPAHQLDLQRFVEFVLECSLDNRVTAEAVRGRLAQNHVSIGLFERALLRFGLIDRLKLQTLNCATGSRRFSATRCRAGAAAVWTRSIRTRRFSSTGSSTGFRMTS
jgi:hypothetical protein